MNFQRFSTQKRVFLSLAIWQFWSIAPLIFTMVCPFVSPYHIILFFLTPLLMFRPTPELRNAKNKSFEMKKFALCGGVVCLIGKRLL